MAEGPLPRLGPAPKAPYTVPPTGANRSSQGAPVLCSQARPRVPEHLPLAPPCWRPLHSGTASHGRGICHGYIPMTTTALDAEQHEGQRTAGEQGRGRRGGRSFPPTRVRRGRGTQGAGRHVRQGTRPDAVMPCTLVMRNPYENVKKGRGRVMGTWLDLAEKVSPWAD